MRIIRSRLSHTLAALAAAILALPPQMPVMAGPAMEKLFLLMKAKGTLSQEEYDMLVAASREEDKERDKAVAAAVAAAPATTSTPAAAGAAQPASTTALEKRLAATESKVGHLENALGQTTNAASLDKRLAQTESKVGNLESAISTTRGQIEDISKITDNTSPSTMSAAELDTLLADKWYERLKMKGYLQVRADSVMREDGGPLHVQNDAFANDQSSIGIRRGRLAFSGDLTNHVYLYFQADLFGGVNGNGGVQARDYYADVSLDPAREHRVRMGLSKVPYGHAILQSSQNRLALERPEAISTAIEGERDFGVYYMYAPYEIRERFKNLVKMGLRGSGDYGMIAFGAFAGQGINKPDTNGQPHWVARATYPFEFENGQFLELGIQGYAGKFNTTTAPIPGVGTPANGNGGNRGFTDARVGISAILYPQPFGIETEWNWGKGPQLSNDMRTITSSSLSGGYVQANYRHVFANQKELIPFARWQTYNGGRKFAVNAPKDKVNEVGFGFRFIPYPELELTAMYMHGMRTNTNLAPYSNVNYDYVGIQAQVNF
ncbi:porin [Prosthecobacter vanneervenii]|uniref:Phosphate-selective porin O and P n=1 Tax=Prosthecobacter vanneervenii TaxID=48466 RepID=A0A7W7YCL7_9BACT|nr:porin [Prosthecobacter vanneervenii]MBB5033716.1 hypothetical protein [Prosthecobacter vanneervenii]